VTRSSARIDRPRRTRGHPAAAKTLPTHSVSIIIRISASYEDTGRDTVLAHRRIPDTRGIRAFDRARRAALQRSARPADFPS